MRVINLHVCETDGLYLVQVYSEQLVSTLYMYCFTVMGSECGAGKFSCDDSTHCIALEATCDGVRDCYDNTDELLAFCRE